MSREGAAAWLARLVPWIGRLRCARVAARESEARFREAADLHAAAAAHNAAAAREVRAAAVRQRRATRGVQAALDQWPAPEDAP